MFIYLFTKILQRSFFSGTFDLLVYTDKESIVPKNWGETGPKFITNSAEVRLKNFNTHVHKVDTMVAYKTYD